MRSQKIEAQRIGLKLRFAPVIDHADRNIHLGMDHPLRGQLRHHPVGDQLVVFRSAQPRGHCLESQHEAAEVLVLIKGLGFLDTQRIAGLPSSDDRIPPAQLDQRFRAHRSFEMKMKLCFGKATQPGPRNRYHSACGAGRHRITCWPRSRLSRSWPKTRCGAGCSRSRSPAQSPAR